MTANPSDADEALIEACAIQFRDYERQHRAKGTPEADAKAEVNRLFAERCEARLSALSPPAREGDDGVVSAVVLEAIGRLRDTVANQPAHWPDRFIADSIMAMPTLLAAYPPQPTPAIQPDAEWVRAEFALKLAEKMPALSMEWSDELREAWLSCAGAIFQAARPPITDEDRAWAIASAKTIFGEDGKEDPNDMAAVAERAMRRAEKAEAELARLSASPPAIQGEEVEVVAMELIGALEPFAAFAPPEWVPDDQAMTQGSRLAKRQVTAADFRYAAAIATKARAILARIRGGEFRTVSEAEAMEGGRWINADDVDALVRRLDVAINGKDAASHPKLCDIVGQMEALAVGSKL